MTVEDVSSQHGLGSLGACEQREGREGKSRLHDVNGTSSERTTELTTIDNE
jgi:hypothetical protein